MIGNSCSLVVTGRSQIRPSSSLLFPVSLRGYALGIDSAGPQRICRDRDLGRHARFYVAHGRFLAIDVDFGKRCDGERPRCLLVTHRDCVSVYARNDRWVISGGRRCLLFLPLTVSWRNHRQRKENGDDYEQSVLHHFRLTE